MSSTPISITFEVPDASADIQLMAIWMLALKNYQQHHSSKKDLLAAAAWFKLHLENELQ